MSIRCYCFCNHCFLADFVLRRYKDKYFITSIIILLLRLIVSAISRRVTRVLGSGQPQSLWAESDIGLITPSRSIIPRLGDEIQISIMIGSLRWMWMVSSWIRHVPRRGVFDCGIPIDIIVIIQAYAYMRIHVYICIYVCICIYIKLFIFECIYMYNMYISVCAERVCVCKYM